MEVINKLSIMDVMDALKTGKTVEINKNGSRKVLNKREMTRIMKPKIAKIIGDGALIHNVETDTVLKCTLLDANTSKSLGKHFYKWDRSRT